MQALLILSPFTYVVVSLILSAISWTVGFSLIGIVLAIFAFFGVLKLVLKAANAMDEKTGRTKKKENDLYLEYKNRINQTANRSMKKTFGKSEPVPDDFFGN